MISNPLYILASKLYHLLEAMMEDWFYYHFGLCIILSIYCLYGFTPRDHKSTPNSNRPPSGPWYSKFIFNPVLRWHEYHGTRRLYIHSLHQKYGPAVRIAPNEYAFQTVAAVRAIYGKGADGLGKSGFYDLFRMFGEVTAFSNTDLKSHAEMVRKIGAPYMESNVKKPGVMDGIKERCSTFVDHVDRLISRSRGLMDVYEYSHYYALDCATHFLLGQSQATASLGVPSEITHRSMVWEMSYHDSIKTQVLHLWSQASFFRKLGIAWLVRRYFPQRPSPRMDEYVIRSCQEQNPEDYSLLYQLQARSIPPKRIEAEIADHLSAAIDTTGDALCFIMYELSRRLYQPTQQKLRRLLRQGNDAYLDAVINEGLRLYPPIPMSQPRVVPPGGKSIDGYQIPAGAIVSVQAWSLHRYAANFIDPDTFVPERWMIPDREVLDKTKSAFLAFGAGPAQCMGQHLARAEMKCLLKEIYTNFSTHVYAYRPSYKKDMEMADQIIASRPRGKKCMLIFQREVSPKKVL